MKRKLLIMALCAMLCLPLGSTAYAAESECTHLGAHAAEVYVDAEENLCMEWVEPDMPGNKTFCITGYSIMREKGAERQEEYHIINYIVRPIAEGEAEQDESGRYVLRIPLSDIGRNDPTWQQEIDDALSGTGEPATFRVDAIMEARKKGKVVGLYRNYGAHDGTCPGAVLDAEEWTDPDCISTYFNKYITVGSQGTYHLMPR